MFVSAVAVPPLSVPVPASVPMTAETSAVERAGITLNAAYASLVEKTTAATGGVTERSGDTSTSRLSEISS